MPVITLVPELPWSMLAKELALSSWLAGEFPPPPLGIPILQVQLLSSRKYVKSLQVIECYYFLIKRMA